MRYRWTARSRPRSSAGRGHRGSSAAGASDQTSAAAMLIVVIAERGAAASRGAGGERRPDSGAELAHPIEILVGDRGAAAARQSLGVKPARKRVSIGQQIDHLTARLDLGVDERQRRRGVLTRGRRGADRVRHGDLDVMQPGKSLARQRPPPQTATSQSATSRSFTLPSRRSTTRDSCRTHAPDGSRTSHHRRAPPPGVGLTGVVLDDQVCNFGQVGAGDVRLGPERREDHPGSRHERGSRPAASAPDTSHAWAATSRTSESTTQHCVATCW